MIPAQGADTTSCVPNPNAPADQDQGSERPRGSYTSPGWDVIINQLNQAGHPPKQPTLSGKLGLPPITHNGWMALASDMISVSGQSQGMQSQDEAIKSAMAQCQAKGGKGCRIVTSQYLSSVPGAVDSKAVAASMADKMAADKKLVAGGMAPQSILQYDAELSALMPEGEEIIASHDKARAAQWQQKYNAIMQARSDAIQKFSQEHSGRSTIFSRLHLFNSNQ